VHFAARQARRDSTDEAVNVLSAMGSLYSSLRASRVPAMNLMAEPSARTECVACQQTTQLRGVVTQDRQRVNARLVQSHLSVLLQSN
jgi:hypothetical protein